jgi:hypothetical protein
MLDSYRDECRGAFEGAKGPTPRKPRVTTSPVSLSRYIRKRLFGDGIMEPHSRRPVRDVTGCPLP